MSVKPNCTTRQPISMASPAIQVIVSNDAPRRQVQAQPQQVGVSACNQRSLSKLSTTQFVSFNGFLRKKQSLGDYSGVRKVLNRSQQKSTTKEPFITQQLKLSRLEDNQGTPRSRRSKRVSASKLERQEPFEVYDEACKKSQYLVSKIAKKTMSHFEKQQTGSNKQSPNKVINGQEETLPEDGDLTNQASHNIFSFQRPSLQDYKNQPQVGQPSHQFSANKTSSESKVKYNRRLQYYSHKKKPFYAHCLMPTTTGTVGEDDNCNPECTSNTQSILQLPAKQPNHDVKQLFYYQAPKSQEVRKRQPRSNSKVYVKLNLGQMKQTKSSIQQWNDSSYGAPQTNVFFEDIIDVGEELLNNNAQKGSQRNASSRQRSSQCLSTRSGKKTPSGRLRSAGGFSASRDSASHRRQFSNVRQQERLPSEFMVSLQQNQHLMSSPKEEEPYKEQDEHPRYRGSSNKKQSPVSRTNKIKSELITFTSQVYKVTEHRNYDKQLFTFENLLKQDASQHDTQQSQKAYRQEIQQPNDDLDVAGW